MAPLSLRENEEKQSAALLSLLAAVGLTALRIVVGFLTGSLGIIAEGAHSGLDLAAAAMTWVAVRISARPADSTHLYGHGKVENLSALFETFILVATCVWIAWEAAHRLLSQTSAVEVTVWSVGVMAASLAVELSRARALARVARKYGSQALEADALHFQTHIWSSGAVILGLLAVSLGQAVPSLAFLQNADAVAAIGVSVVVAWASWALGWRTVDALVDSAPVGMEQRIAGAVAAIPGVRNCHRVRIRYSGPVPFIDLHIIVDGDQTLTQAHGLTERIESAIQEIVPRADVTIHPEPFEH